MVQTLEVYVIAEYDAVEGENIVKMLLCATENFNFCVFACPEEKPLRVGDMVNFSYDTNETDQQDIHMNCQRYKVLKLK